MRQERVYRTEAIVLRELNYAEADRILTLLTPGGKLNALAKGIRRPTSHKVGHLGLFFRVRLMLARGRNLDIITQAESLEDHDGLRSDLLRFSYACYIGELVERFSQEEEENQPLYDLMVQALCWLANEQDPRLWTRYFELRVLTVSGYQPDLFHCVSCHRTIVPETNYLHAAQGGFLCARCGPAQAQARAVSLNAQKVLRYLQTHGAEDVRALNVGPATHSEIESLLRGYLEFTLERELKSAAFLQRLRREMTSP